MSNVTRENITQKVIEHGDGGKTHPRLYQIYAGLVKHLHNFVRETNLTEIELERARDFLTRAARSSSEMADGEIQLLFDLLGLSELVVILNEKSAGKTTESNIEGPLYLPNAPERKMGEQLGADADGEALVLSGLVVDRNGNPIANALLDVWQADSRGVYDPHDPEKREGHFRGRYRTGADGRYCFATVVPKGYKVPEEGPCGEVLKLLGRHAWRAAHIHFKLSAPGYRPLTTQLYIDGAPYLDSDTTFAVKDAIITLRPAPGEKRSYVSEFNFILDSQMEDRQT